MGGGAGFAVANCGIVAKLGVIVEEFVLLDVWIVVVCRDSPDGHGGFFRESWYWHWK